MSLNISTNNNYYNSYTKEVNLDNRAEDNTIDDLKLRQKLLNKQLNEKNEADRMNLKLAFKKTSEILENIGMEKTGTTQEERLTQFLQESNMLNENLEHLQNTGSVDNGLVDEIHQWSHNALAEIVSTKNEDNIKTSMRNQISLINQTTTLVKKLVSHAQQKIPLGETEESATAQKDQTPDNEIGADVNIYLVSLNLVFCTNIMVMNAISIESQFNDFLQKMMKDLNDFQALLAVVKRAFTDAQAQAAAETDKNTKLDPGWESKDIFDHNGNLVDMYQLLTAYKLDSNHAPVKDKDGNYVYAFPEWKDNVIEGDPPNKIQLCFFDQNKDGKNGATVNPLLAKFATQKGGKYFMDEDAIKAMLGSIGGRMAKFTGGNLATQNTEGFKTSSGLEGLMNAGTSAITNIQAQSTASVSRLGIDNQNLVSAISNFVTLVSNLLSGMMKLAAV